MSRRVLARRERSRLRLPLIPLVLLVGALAVAVVGCGADAADVTSGGPGAAPASAGVDGPDPLAMTIRAPADGSAVLVDDGDALRVLDPSTGAERFTATGAVASGDGSLVVAAEHQAAATVVRVRSVADGSIRWATTVPGSLEVVGVSSGGETVVLVDPDAAAGTTAFVVVRFAFPDRTDAPGSSWDLAPEVLAAPLPSSQRIDVDGQLEYDGIADSTGAIFVLQRSPVDADAYKVRLLSLADGLLIDMATREKIVPEGEMYGRFRSSVTVPYRGEVATLYTVDGSGSSGAAFVHLLNTTFGYADCLDLPAPIGRGDPSTLAIAAARGGNPLYVHDSAAGSIAIVNPDVLGDVRIVAIPELAGVTGRPAAIAAGLDGRLALAAGDQVVRFDPRSATVTSWPAGGEVSGLATVGPSGVVAAIVDGRVHLFDATGTRIDPDVGPTDAAAVATTTAPQVPVASAAPTTAATLSPVSVVELDPTTVPPVAGTAVIERGPTGGGSSVPGRP